ncbi:MAG TPA: zinc ribbon domain-containing protein [Longimicrobiaceae bacterium]|nr:zinc ribbon domain-containing protein [Longimicrobiaceae bacterium]
MPKSCPSCGSRTSGKFCSQCGTPLDAPSCASCGNQIPEGGRFCNLCGTPVAVEAGRGGGKKAKAAPVPEPAASGAGISNNLPWFVAGAALAGLAVVLVVTQFRSDSDLPVSAPIAGGAASGAGAGGAAGVDLSSMSPREAADRLFNRVMTTVATGDTAEARAFAPMAIASYEMAGDLDLDGRYHLAVIHLVNGQPDEALAVANAMLAEVPTHLFGHFSAAEAEQMRGNPEAAAGHYRAFLENFEAEIARGRAEYAEHQAALPGMRQQAAQAVGGP